MKYRNNITYPFLLTQLVKVVFSDVLMTKGKKMCREMLEKTLFSIQIFVRSVKFIQTDSIYQNANKRIYILFLFLFCVGLTQSANAQLNTKNILLVGRNAMYYDDYTEAIKHFNNVIIVKPHLPEPYFFRAVAKLNLEDYAGALNDCNKAIELNPNYAYAYIYRGIARHHLKDYDGAMQDYEKVSHLAPDNAINYANRGITKAAKGDFKGAIDDYTLSLKFDKTIIGVYLNRAIAKQKLEDTEGALADVNQAIALNMFYADAYNTRGYLKYTQKNYQSAILDYDKSISLEPKNARTYMIRGIARYELNDLQGTLDDYNQAIALEPYNASALFNRAMLKAEVGDANAALADLEKTLELQPQNILFWYNHGVVKLEMKQYQEAISDFDEAIRIYPDFARAYLARSEAKRNLRNYASAEEDLKKALRIVDENSDVKTVAELKNYRDTTANFQALIDINSKEFTDEEVTDGRIQNKNVFVSLLADYRVIVNATEKKDRLLNYEKHIAAYNAKNNFEQNIALSNHQVKKSVERQKSKTPFIQGIIELENENYQQSINAFTKSIEQNDAVLLSYLNRAYAYTKMVEYVAEFEDSRAVFGVETVKRETIIDYSQAIQDYDNLIKNDSEFAYAYYNRANLYAKSKQIEKALADYEKAIELDRYFAEAYYNRGIVKIYKGDTHSAAKDLSKAGELGIESAYHIIKRYCN